MRYQQWSPWLYKSSVDLLINTTTFRIYYRHEGFEIREDGAFELLGVARQVISRNQVQIS